ncbi:hypothetical protein KA111_02480 [Candidatus Woesebacteria bacterium]|nr:hypothetical protein [Candidatus Woesebacteria bacterium]
MFLPGRFDRPTSLGREKLEARLRGLYLQIQGMISIGILGSTDQSKKEEANVEVEAAAPTEEEISAEEN